MTFHPNQMDIIDRRQVEALILGPMLRAFQNEIGIEKTNEIARTVITKLAREQGAQFAQDIGSNQLEDYASNKDAWRRNGALGAVRSQTTTRRGEAGMEEAPTWRLRAEPPARILARFPSPGAR